MELLDVHRLAAVNMRGAVGKPLMLSSTPEKSRRR
jgi:hypothetical protein